MIDEGVEVGEEACSWLKFDGGRGMGSGSLVATVSVRDVGYLEDLWW